MLAGVQTAVMKSGVHVGSTRPTCAITVGGVTMADVISVSIDRSKGGASQATFVVDNKAGAKAPDPGGDYYHILWPGKTVTISMGYGGSQVLLFTGLVDTCTMQNPPARITCTCRDMSKLALDAMIQTDVDGVRVYGITYLDQTLEYIFRDLALKAGYAAGNIIADITGITLKEITFSREQYADAFQKLCELCLFEWYCDEAGKLVFRKATEAASTSYTFAEGEDLFEISYEISDADIYTRIYVEGRDEDGKPITATALLDESQYALSLQKTLFINANDIVTTTANCQTLANYEAAQVATKARNVTIKVIGNPWIQIGDAIQVTETSSTISEIYRVLEITHSMDADGSPIFSSNIKCYAYAAGS